MANLSRLHSNLIFQKSIQEEDLALVQHTFNANDTLKRQKVISEGDYRIEKSKLLNKSLTIPQLNASIISNESQQNDKKKEILELENNIAQQKIIFEQALNTFKSQVGAWMKKYLLIAPIDGKFFFASFIQENQQIKAGQPICYVKPENSLYYAEIHIPQTNFGKVKMGQKVLLKLPAYPYAEFGSIEGRVNFISRIPIDSSYAARIILPNGLLTNYAKPVYFTEGLKANAEIITEDLRLLERFYYSIYNQGINR
ncbi:HlyD family secretion protein [Flavihumibacter sp. ZG627]|uniref:HlyD family secretion protein n=1 Tax=Flavihumibacter sp. ZG627 TaxID=1463156 RepID=UPI00155B1F57|nr:HlyD family efflux transporter periplasmic adaptor subunit [Flavihumibacter sp. ZG627]